MKMILLVIVFIIAGVENLNFHCTFRMFPWPVIDDVYECKAVVTGSGTLLATVSGDHLQGKTHAQVENLVFNDQTMYLLPTDINRFFPNLISLMIFNSNLLAINAVNLQPFPNMIIFAASNNPLVTIPGNLFNYTRKLAIIELYGNQLQHVGDNLLTGLEDLILVNFGSNPCISKAANTKEEIEELNSQLPISCPSSTETTQATTTVTTELPTTANEAATTTTELPVECSAGCLKQIDELEARTRELERKIDELHFPTLIKRF